ncbi:hypothetical protein N658DRAFT_482183 [Parathielavia hyrcaniae]|uniref:Nuclear GTPase SLIP-GC n=1 Tax=Parathielavia hyrcaniae TaxID=113614 RepID=A0AAN6Q9T5_9PEZI|nr:hypothetical protein N658DRAFT_482183 [Parathielavia hyrcaniae]
MGEASSFGQPGPLQELSSDDFLEKLEAGVEAGLRILGEVKNAFANASSVPKIAKWIKSSTKLQSQAGSQRTVVGVVGSTGAGKSSVINATLDEECLVLTNCMRACRAVITEIAYNDSERDDEKYRAEVHFISRQDWIRELRVLQDDMHTADQSSLDMEQPSGDSSAAVAYEKIRSVYPFLNRNEVKKAKFDIQELRVASATSDQFLGLLEKFIDSKEKTAGRKKELGAMEYWPLVKVVKIFVPSPILKSGLILVDLPSVQDSNAARSAVASRYIQECSGLWVVAPITRTADDKVAQNLLGDTFRRQLQFVGTYSRITFICSKADDIDSMEKLQVVISELKQQMSDLDKGIDQCDTEIEELRSAMDASDDEDEILDEEPSASEAEAEKEAISKELAAQGLREAEARLAALRAESKELKKRCQPHQKELKEVKHEIKLRKSEVKHACISYRNESIDQDNAAHNDETFDPAHLQRDYTEIARKLPVFCVSSKAYQKMSGRLKNDERTSATFWMQTMEKPASTPLRKALVDPMTKQLAQSWEYVFSTCLPDMLDTLAESLGKSLRTFRKQTSQRQQLTKSSLFALVTRQGRFLEKGLKDTTELKGILRSGQKEANQLAVPVIAEAMADGYAICMKESGTSCWKRIKEYFVDHVEMERVEMFQTAARKTRDALSATLDEVEAAVDRNVEGIVEQINNDYSCLLRDESIFKELRAARESIRELLAQVDERFERVLRCPVDSTDLYRAEKALAMGGDHEAPATAVGSNVPSERPRSSAKTPTIPRTELSPATGSDGKTLIKLERSSTPALGGEDMPMWDV